MGGHFLNDMLYKKWIINVWSIKLWSITLFRTFANPEDIIKGNALCERKKH